MNFKSVFDIRSYNGNCDIGSIAFAWRIYVLKLVICWISSCKQFIQADLIKTMVLANLQDINILQPRNIQSLRELDSLTNSNRWPHHLTLEIIKTNVWKQPTIWKFKWMFCFFFKTGTKQNYTYCKTNARTRSPKLDCFIVLYNKFAQIDEIFICVFAEVYQKFEFKCRYISFNLLFIRGNETR